MPIDKFARLQRMVYTQIDLILILCYVETRCNYQKVKLQSQPAFPAVRDAILCAGMLMNNTCTCMLLRGPGQCRKLVKQV